jgi:triacylglycerol lipase
MTGGEVLGAKAVAGAAEVGSFSSSPSCVSCDQQRAGSDFLTALNNPDETPGDIDYTQVETKYDEVVVPYTLQDGCAADAAEHLTIPMDPQAIAWVLDAVHHDGAANPAAPIGCAG